MEALAAPPQPVHGGQHKNKPPTGLSSNELILAFRKAAAINGLNFDLLLTEALTPSTPRGTAPPSTADDYDEDDYDEDAADLAVTQRLLVLEALSKADAAADADDADLESALAASLKLSTSDSNTRAGTSEPSGAIRDKAGKVVQPPDDPDEDMDGDATDEEEEEEEGEEEETDSFEPDPLVAAEPVVPKAAPQAAPTAAAKAAPKVAPKVAPAAVLAEHKGLTDNASAENAHMVSVCHTGGLKTLIPFGEANSNNAMIDWKAFCRQVRNQVIITMIRCFDSCG